MNRVERFLADPVEVLSVLTVLVLLGCVAWTIRWTVVHTPAPPMRVQLYDRSSIRIECDPGWETAVDFQPDVFADRRVFRVTCIREERAP
jgi:hypothetical protein